MARVLISMPEEFLAKSTTWDSEQRSSELIREALRVYPQAQNQKNSLAAQNATTLESLLE